MLDAVRPGAPDLIVAPMLTRAIPEAIWRRHVCLVVHPGPPGDRGPSCAGLGHPGGAAALGRDRAAGRGRPRRRTDLGRGTSSPCAGSARAALYSHEVTEAAVRALREAVARFAGGERTAPPPGPAGSAGAGVRGRPRPPVRQGDRRIDWAGPTDARPARAVERRREPRRAGAHRRPAGLPVRGLPGGRACAAPRAPSWPRATGRSAAPRATAPCGSRRMKRRPAPGDERPAIKLPATPGARSGAAGRRAPRSRWPRTPRRPGAPTASCSTGSGARSASSTSPSPTAR